MSLRLISVDRCIARPRQKSRARRHQRTWVLEGLEARALLSGGATYYTVNLTSDTGASSGIDANTGDPSGDLLWAIGQANANTNPRGSVINFDFATPQTIALTSTLELSESGGPETIQGPGSGQLTISGGNAVGVFLVDSDVTACLSGLTISGGSAYNGGGIWNNGTLSISGSTFSCDTASYLGGGVFNQGAATLSADGFTDDSAGFGGGVFNLGALGDTGSTYTGGTAVNQGGGFYDSATATLNGDNFSGDSAGNQGGGIYNAGSASLTVLASTLADSTAGAGGGLFNTGTAVVNDSTLAGNTADGYGGGYGGGIWSQNPLTIVNSTIADNTASGYGGGIYNESGLTLVNSTIAYNSAGSGGGGISDYVATVTLNNTIVVENTQGTGLSAASDDLEEGGGSVFVGANDLVGTDDEGTLSGAGDLLGVTDPGIGLLASNGGQTETIALLAGSPAIGSGSVALAADPTTGDALVYDQRGAGFPRYVNGTVDIGAFERPATIGSPTVYTVTDNSGSGTDTASLPYAIAQADANTNLAGSIIEFDPSVFSAATPQTITLTGTLELSEPSGPITITDPGAAAVTISGANAVVVFQVDTGVVANLSGLTIADGSGSYGGGILNEPDAKLTLSASTVMDNTAPGGDGGGLANFYQATLSDCTFTDDGANNSGGGIWNIGTLSISGSTFVGETAGYLGGGVFNQGAATLSADGFTGDSAGFGGGVFDLGTLGDTGSTYTGDTASNQGGGFYDSATATLDDDTFSGDSAGNQGGGIYNAGSSSLTVLTSTLADSTAGAGGGLFNNGIAVVEDSTLAGNTALQGGGITNGAVLTVVNSTIAYNISANGGAGIYNGNGTATLYNTIVVSNAVATYVGAPTDDLGGLAFSSASAYNLIGSDDTGSITGNGNQVGVTDPGLGLLGWNGGPTQTIALLANSPAIDAGSNALAVDPTTNMPLAYDQRGVGYPRVVGASVDIGAFERPATIGSPTEYTVDLTSASGAGSGDCGDLVYVIEQADANVNLAGSVITFDPTVFGVHQTITLSSTLELGEPSGPMVFDGPGAGLVTISGNNAVVVLQVDNGAVVTLSQLTVSGGSTANLGGGILNDNFGTLSVLESTICGNVAGDGGGIASGGMLSIVDSVFSGNTASNMGGGLISTGPVTVTNSTFTADWAGNNGGGIENIGTLTVSGSTFSGDTANSSGGGINNDGTVTVTDSCFDDDLATSGGGFAATGPGTISDSTFSTDSAFSSGGALVNQSSSLTVSGSTFVNNTVSYNGGAIFNNGDLAISTSTLSDNTAGSAGGAIINYGHLSVTASTLSGNSGGGGGGGIYNQNVAAGTSVTVVNSTLAGNTASQGGAIYTDAASLSVTDSTIAYNIAGSGGAGIYNSGGSPTLENTIVDSNAVATYVGAPDDDLDGSAFASNCAYDLIGIDNTSSITGNGNLVGVTDPGLGLLGWNGGPTQTIALLANSPAIDAGSNALAVDPTTNLRLEYDQRGVGYPRVVNGTVDIGAFEYHVPPQVVSITSVTSPRNANVSSLDVTFSELINPTSFTDSALTLTDDGGPNLITNTVTVSLLSGATYQISGLSGLTKSDGIYAFTVNATGVEDPFYLAGVGSLSTLWLMDTTAPSSHVVNSLGTSQTHDTFPVSVAFTDPAGSGGAPASGVSTVELWVSVNSGPFTLSQKMNITPADSGTAIFNFVGQDRNIYSFHSLAIDAAGNSESKGVNTTEASTSVPDLNPPVTHVLASSTYNNAGVFTLNWSGTDPDRNSGTPAGSIALVDIYVSVSGGTPTLIDQVNGGTPNGSGVYSGSITYDALADNQTHTYGFFSVGIDDEQKAQATPGSPDVTFSEKYAAQLAISSFAVEKGIAERSFVEYLDVYFNQTAISSTALESLATALQTPSSADNSYIELLWYGENQTLDGSVNLFNTGTTASVTLNGNDLSISFGPNGITSLLPGSAGALSPSKTFGDGWYALGINPDGSGQLPWQTFFRLLGDTDGDGVVTGPYTTAGTDAYNVYHSEGQSGLLLNTDVDGSGAVNSKDLTYTTNAKGDAVGLAPTSFPLFQLFGGAAVAVPVNATPITQGEVQALVPEAIAAWQAAGLDSAGVRKLEAVPVQVGNLGTNILGLEAAGVITINQTAAGYDWYVGTTGSGSPQAFGLAGPDGELLAGPGSPAASEVDLLTVIEHELGHVIGLADNTEAGDLMDITLGLGVSRAPSSQDVALTQRAAGVVGPLSASEKQSQQPSPSIGPVTQATVDAALASMAAAAGGNGDGQGLTVNNGSPAKSGVQVLFAAIPEGKGRVNNAAVPHPHGHLSSRFTAKVRRPGQSSATKTKDAAKEPRD